jgi:glycosidase
MLHGDPRRLRMAFSLLFSLPGAPMIFYGDEIGMGELPGMTDREAVRTPMQWDSGRNGGFSTARPSRLPSQIPSGGFGPEHINALSQLRAPDSLLSTIRRLVSCYRANSHIACGDFSVVESGKPGVLVHRSVTGTDDFIAMHNFGEEAAQVEVTLTGRAETAELVDLLEDEPSIPVDGGVATIELDAYGYRWFALTRRG